MQKEGEGLGLKVPYALTRVLAESCAKSRNKQGGSREPGRVESGIKEARVGKQEGRESGNVDQSRETWTKERYPYLEAIAASCKTVCKFT